MRRLLILALVLRVSAAVAALRPARLASGEAGFLVWGNGAWQEVRGDRIAPASNEWMQAKFVVRTVDGEKLVSYLVRSGADDVRLQTASGQGWFRASAAALAPALPPFFAAQGFAVAWQRAGWDKSYAAGTTNMQKPSPERWHAAQGSMYCEWLADDRFALAPAPAISRCAADMPRSLRMAA